MFKDVLLWLLLPFESDDDRDLAHKHVVICLAREHDQNRVVLMAEREFDKHLSVSCISLTLRVDLSSRELYDTLQKEDVFRLLSFVLTLFRKDGNLPEITAL